MPLVSVVVPVYCNAGSLQALQERLEAVAQCHADTRFEFIYVDDGSYDASYQVLQQLAARDGRVRVVKLTRNFGSNPAVLAGLTYARGDCAAILAADLQDPPELIGEMLKRWRNGSRVVLAGRRRRADPALTRLSAHAFHALFRLLAFQDFPPHGCDYALVDQQVVRTLLSCGEKNTHLFGLIMWTGYGCDVVYYDRAERQHGRSMWTVPRKVKYLIDAVASFSYLPLRLASGIGLLLAVGGGIYALAALAARIFASVPVQGWTSLMVALLLTSGVQLIMLGVIGEYVWRGLDQTRRRPLFVVDTLLGQQDDGVQSGDASLEGRPDEVRR